MDDRARSYTQGNCDIMALALALHRLTGKPMGLWSGKFFDPDSDDGVNYEHAHAVVTLEDGKWLDVYGIGSGTPNLYFNSMVTEVVLLPASEEDVRDAFTCCEIDDESIRAAMAFALEYPPLAQCLTDLLPGRAEALAAQFIEASPIDTESTDEYEWTYRTLSRQDLIDTGLLHDFDAHAASIGLDPAQSVLSRPVVVTTGDAKERYPLAVWDGVHRIMSALARGEASIPAAYGVRKLVMRDTMLPDLSLADAELPTDLVASGCAILTLRDRS